MLITFLTVWVVTLSITFIIEYTRWRLKVKESRWRVHDINYWLPINQFIIISTLLILLFLLITLTTVYIII